MKLKYNKRCSRLNNLCNGDNSILFIRKGENDTIDSILKLYNTIIKCYSKLNFKILLINNLENSIENNNTNIIIYRLPYECFLSINVLKNYAGHRNNEKAYEEVYNILSKFKAKKFAQPRYRDLIP